MKKLFCLLLLILTGITRSNAGCPTCGGPGANALRHDTGPAFTISMGNAQFGQSAGELTFGSTLPDPNLFTPALLMYSGASRTDVIVVNTNVIDATLETNITSDAELTTNYYIITNTYSTDGGPVTYYVTNPIYALEVDTVTNVTDIYVTNTEIRQVYAPQALADIPIPPTPNGYVINFYYPSSVGSVNPDGTYAVSGTPFATWLVTNLAPSSINQLQVSESTAVDGLLKQWTYTYSATAGTWTMGTLGGIQDMAVNNLGTNEFEVINSVQYSNGPVALQIQTTYTNLSFGAVVPTEIDLGPSTALKTTRYTYYDPSPNGNMTLKKTVVNPDGSWIYYEDYATNGIADDVFYGFGDAALDDTSHAREVKSTFSPTVAGLTGSGDDGSINSTVPRRKIEYLEGQEVSRHYTVFPSVGVRLEIQCVAAGAGWSDAGNLVTTNFYFTSGANQYALQSVIRPDGTMTVYNYANNGTNWTNTVVTGQPDSAYAYIVDGTSNQTVVNQWGYPVSSTTWDVKQAAMLSQDIYGNYDTYGRPQQVAHLDGTIETNIYACCGLQNSIDRNGVDTVYLYNADKRQYGYAQYFSTTGNPIATEKVLDAVGRPVETFREGTDYSTVVQSQSGYDTAGRLLAQTNALGGVTTSVETTNITTGGLIRTSTNPDGGTRVEAYYLDGTLKSVTGTGVHGKGYGYGTGTGALANQQYTCVTNLDGSGNATAEWTETFTDMAGRTTEVLYSDGHYSQYYYNPQGQLSKQVDPDGVTTLYQYNGKGEQVITAIAMTGSSATTPNFSGTDRITSTTNDVTTSDHSTTTRRSCTYAWTKDTFNSSSLLSESEFSADGLNSWQVKCADVTASVTSQTAKSYSGSGQTTIFTAPDGSYTSNSYSFGRLVSSKKVDSSNNQIGGTTYVYDPHGRQYQVTDARNGTTTYGYNNADQVNSVTTPTPAAGQSAETTTTLYDTMLRPYSITQPDGTTVNSVYLLTGELGLQYGSRTYPVEYAYDYAGRMQFMTNWTSYGSLTGARVTTWLYDGQRGWLTNKVYADTHSIVYTNTPAGRLHSRTWARGITTTYAYDNAGSLSGISYNDGGVTPSVTYGCDRMGRQTTNIWNGITDVLSYNLANQPLGKAFSGGILAGFCVTNIYDPLLRRTNLSVLSGGSQFLATAYGYDAASRLLGVTNLNDNDSATYSYLANSPLVSQITFRQSGTTRMTTTQHYDDLNRLTQISSQPSSGLPPATFNYNYNPANQRTKDTLVDGSYWVYGYDSLGQVTNGCKYFFDGTPVPGQQFDYLFDTIGNRTQTLAGGDQTGHNQRLASYSVNNLNQITSRDFPGTNDVLGVALATNGVSINGSTNVFRKGEYFWAMVNTNNATSNAWEIVTVASGGNSTTGGLYVPQTRENFTYDLDGNLISDGHWNYTWDAENRLTAMTNNALVGPSNQMTFAYDPKGRRIQKLVVSNGVAIYTNRFLYDGWNLMAELKPNNSPVRTYVWGSDLSGSMQSAGGVGGLLEVSYTGNSTTNCFPAFDGNGNLRSLFNAADGTALANYEYGPFGEVVRQTGPMAKVNPIRFSTKYQDDESDLLYYGYRYYKASTGTWPSRDPIEERGGLNLYLAANNNFINNYDLLGKDSSAPTPGPVQIGSPINILDGGNNIGTINIDKYYAFPAPARPHGPNDDIGAHLVISVNIADCSGCCEYKWRQYKSDTDPNHPFTNAPDVLPPDTEWYSPNMADGPNDPFSSTCAYTFSDTPTMPGTEPQQDPSWPQNDGHIDKITVSFKLQLVKVCGDTKTVITTLYWGFWYTYTGNGLLPVNF